MSASASQSVHDVVEMKPLGEDMYQGPAIPTAFTRTFGGQVVAQGLRAAQLTVDGKNTHSLHCYFLEGGVAAQPIDFGLSAFAMVALSRHGAWKGTKTANA